MCNIVVTKFAVQQLTCILWQRNTRNVFSQPLPNNDRLFWLQCSGSQASCHNTHLLQEEADLVVQSVLFLLQDVPAQLSFLMKETPDRLTCYQDGDVSRALSVIRFSNILGVAHIYILLNIIYTHFIDIPKRERIELFMIIIIRHSNLNSDWCSKNEKEIMTVQHDFIIYDVD
jgi:hypothetical protein